MTADVSMRALQAFGFGQLALWVLLVSLHLRLRVLEKGRGGR